MVNWSFNIGLGPSLGSKFLCS